MSDRVTFKDFERGPASITVDSPCEPPCGEGCPPVYLAVDAGAGPFGGSKGVMTLSRKQTKKLIKVLRRLLKESEA